MIENIICPQCGGQVVDGDKRPVGHHVNAVLTAECENPKCTYIEWDFKK